MLYPKIGGFPIQNNDFGIGTRSCISGSLNGAFVAPDMVSADLEKTLSNLTNIPIAEIMLKGSSLSSYA